MVSIGTMRGKMNEIKSSPESKRYFYTVVVCVVALVVVVLAVLIGGIRSISKARSGLRAADIVQGTALSTERNAAGGLIVDINYDVIVGYDANKNPIYGTHGLLPAVIGYDICGTPVEAEGLTVTETALDSLPVYGNFSSIDEARKRGLASRDTNIAWNSIVGYGQDNNPIFAANVEEPNVLGYDVLSTPVEKGTVVEVGRTQTGMPIYDYSVIATAKMLGVQDQERIFAEKSLENIMEGGAKETTAEEEGES